MKAILSTKWVDHEISGIKAQLFSMVGWWIEGWGGGGLGGGCGLGGIWGEWCAGEGCCGWWREDGW